LADIGSLAQQVATTAISLTRSRADAEGSIAVLLRLAVYRTDVIRLARARCLAALDQNPQDSAAQDAIKFLDDVLRRLSA
jgi:hypothetical protein